MSILIKGVDMSPNIQCITVFPEGFAVVEEYEMLLPIKTTKCEVAPVPTPHGRLIDVKALERMDFSNWIMQGDVGYVPFMEVSAAIFNAPTIMEAEEEE